MLGHSGLEVICFVVIWALQLLIIQRGMETVRRFQDWAGPAVWLMMLVLAVYLCIKAGGISLIAPIPQDVLLEKTREAGVPGVPGSPAALGAVAATWVTYFAALYLNFCDFSRYAPDTAALRKGNIWGLPVNLILFSLVAGVTTIAAFHVYRRGAAASRADLGEIRQLVPGAARGGHLCGGDARHQRGRQLRVACIRFLQRLSKTYRLQEGRLYRRADRAGAVSLRALGRQRRLASSALIGATMGPIFGIMMVDYYLIARGRVNVPALYQEHGEYRYQNGWNVSALIAAGVGALFSSILPNFTSILPDWWARVWLVLRRSDRGRGVLWPAGGDAEPRRGGGLTFSLNEVARSGSSGPEGPKIVNQPASRAPTGVSY